jgi:hypothetical protein
LRREKKKKGLWRASEGNTFFLAMKEKKTPLSLFLGRRHLNNKEGGDKAQGSLSHSSPEREKREKKGDGSWGRHSDRRAPGGTGSARCVRRLDGSLVPAIRITYRVSLRSSSSREPRYPSTGVVSGFLVSCFFVSQKTKTKGSKVFNAFSLSVFFFLALFFFQILLREREKRRSTVRG